MSDVLTEEERATRDGWAGWAKSSDELIAIIDRLVGEVERLRSPSLGLGYTDGVKAGLLRAADMTYAEIHALLQKQSSGLVPLHGPADDVLGALGQLEKSIRAEAEGGS